MTAAVLEAALALVARTGWPVFPTVGKHPAIKGGKGLTTRPPTPTSSAACSLALLTPTGSASTAAPLGSPSLTPT